MAADELTKALLLEDVSTATSVAEALFASVNGGVPLLRALVDSDAASHLVLEQLLARNHETPRLARVTPDRDLSARLPHGLCDRLLAIPIHQDPITGTVDIVVADPSDPHPAEELAFHLGVTARVFRAPLAEIEDALRRLKSTSFAETHEMELGRSASSLPVSPPSFVGGRRTRTPPWGTPIHSLGHVGPRSPSEPAKSKDGSAIPIPLTRKTMGPVAPSGAGSPLVNALRGDLMNDRAVPGPPPLPHIRPHSDVPPPLPFPEVSGVIAALRHAATRDDVLELVLIGARMVARRVGLFVVKKGGYLGRAGTPEFADQATLQSIVIPLDENSIFDRAVREDLYLGPVPNDDVHAPLLRVLTAPSRDVAVVPVRVTGKTAVIIVADELGHTMIGTRRLEELARAAGEAFERILRKRR